MKRIIAFGLCFLLLAGCTNQHISPNSPSSDSSPEDTPLSEDNQHEADLLPNESMESSGNITTDIDYEWYLWGNTYVREDGTTFFMNYGDEPLQIPNALSCEINGVVLCSTPQINGELVSDGLLYSMEDGDGGIIEILYSYTDNVIHISDLRTSELDYSGDYYLAEDSFGQPLYPWYEGKFFYNSDTDIYIRANLNNGYLIFVVMFGWRGVSAVYVAVQAEDVEVSANEELGGYNYHYVYERNQKYKYNYIDLMYNTESDMLCILDASGTDFNFSGFYYGIMK